MKRTDRIKLNFTRGWSLPGKERLAAWLKPSPQFKGEMKDGIVWLANEDIAIYTTADNYIEWAILSTGTYEDEIGKLIKISLSPGDTVLDIGANIGLQSIRMGLAVGTAGKVYAFEPLLHLQEKFTRNITLNRLSNIALFPYALADAASEAEFHINKSNWNQGTFNIENRSTGTDVQRVTIKVPDEMPEIDGLDALHLVKIDVEGYEYHVLRGLSQTLQKHRPRIIFEYDDNYWLKAGQSINDCYSFLKQMRYQVYQITQAGCRLINSAADIAGGNLLCICTS